MRSSFRFNSSPRRRSTAIAKLAAAGLAVGVLATFVFKVDIVAQAPIRVVASDTTRPITAQIAAVVSAFDVEEGDEVTKGQRVARLSEPSLMVSHDHLRQKLTQLRAERIVYDALIEELGADAVKARLVAYVRAGSRDESQWISLYQSNLNAHRATVAEFRDRFADLDVSRERILTHRATAEEKLATFADKRSALIELADRGVSARFARIEADLEFLELREARSGLEQDLLANASRRSLLERERQRYLADRINRLKERLKTLVADIADTEQGIAEVVAKIEKLDVYAPVDGIAQEIAVDRLNQLSGDERLLSIVPKGNELVLLARIKNQDIGFVRAGLPATVILEAFSPTRFGTLEGHVTNVTEDVVARAQAIPVPEAITDLRRIENDIGKTQTVPTYVARLELSPGVVERLALRPGMTGLANIKTGQRKVADFFLDPLFRAWNSALIER